MLTHRWLLAFVVFTLAAAGPLAGQDEADLPVEPDKPKPGINDQKPDDKKPDEKKGDPDAKRKKKRIRLGFIHLGTARGMVDELLGTPLVGSDIPMLNRVKNIYRDGTEVNFFDNQTITVLPGYRAQQTGDGRFMVEREGYRVFIDANLLPACGHPPLTPDLKCRIESEFNYALPVAGPPGVAPRWRPTMTCCDTLRYQPPLYPYLCPSRWFHCVKNCRPQGGNGGSCGAGSAPGVPYYGAAGPAPGMPVDGVAPGQMGACCGGANVPGGPVLAPGRGTHAAPGMLPEPAYVPGPDMPAP
ncbi:MAG: hypothetical protein AB7K24_08140 [Gemmataceae bacterium]